MWCIMWSSGFGGHDMHCGGWLGDPGIGFEFEFSFEQGFVIINAKYYSKATRGAQYMLYLANMDYPWYRRQHSTYWAGGHRECPARRCGGGPGARASATRRRGRCSTRAPGGAAGAQPPAEARLRI
jgi:hypothetical protein